MSKILESFHLSDRMVSLCLYQDKPTVIVQDPEISWKSMDDWEDAIEVFDMVIRDWLQEEEIESAFFFQHPEVQA